MQYGKGAASVIPGLALLPNTGSNRVLFIVALSLLACGTAILVASAIASRKARQGAAN